MLKTCLVVLGFIMVCLSPMSFGQDVDQRSELKATLEKLIGVNQVESLTPSKQFPGLIEVATRDGLLLASPDGRFFIDGPVIETATGKNLSEERLFKMHALDVKSMDLSGSIKIVRGSGERTLVVFVDPNCGYCKKIHGELMTVKDVTIHLIPYNILSADSEKKSTQIMCSDNPATAWDAWMTKGVLPAQVSSCATPFKMYSDLGRKHKVRGVPTLFFEDGSRVPGYINAAQIEKRLAR